MEVLETQLKSLYHSGVVKAVLSAPASGDIGRRVNIRPVTIRGQEQYQFERLTEKQAFHENVEPETAAEKTIEFLGPKAFRQLSVWTAEEQHNFRITKKGKILSNRQKQKSEPVENAHNRKKQYRIPEGTPVPPLVDLGVFTKDGTIVKAMYDKYRQIDRFIQMVEDVLKEEGILENPPKSALRIVDFGCGKAYLTFILYYYLTEVLHINVEMIGLDLKEDVIRHCTEVAEKYGYQNLHFQCGDIADFHPEETMDMVISLHACDTATDLALYHAMRWQSRMILSVPCCQHEVNGQLSSDAVPAVTEYGILKERMAALVTDGLRADILKANGYQVQILEFIDMEHSPKNLLIRARYTGRKNRQAEKNVQDLIDRLHIRPTLYTLMSKEEK